MEKLAILIPTYFRKELLFSAIDSAIKLQNCKVYVCFDTKDDQNFPFVAEKYKNVIFYTKENGGISDTRNFLINNSDSEYILFLDDDDQISNEFVNWWNNNINNINEDVYKLNIVIANELKIVKKLHYKMSHKYLAKSDYFVTCQVSSFLIKRNFYNNAELTFKLDHLAEDHSFAADIYWKNRKIINTKIVCTISLQHNDERLTNRLSVDKLNKYLNEAKYMLDNYKKNKIYIPMSVNIIRWLVLIKNENSNTQFYNEVFKIIKQLRKKLIYVLIYAPAYYKFLQTKFLLKKITTF